MAGKAQAPSPSLIYRRNGDSSEGDARFTLDEDASTLESYGKSGRKYITLDAAGRPVRWTGTPRNVYMDAKVAGDVDTLSFGVVVESVSTTAPASQAPEGAADAILDRLIKTGNVEALALHLASIRGANRAAKMDTARAEALIG